MTLNGTLFVQIINFFIAYFVIDRLLLRKAVSYIQGERMQQDTLMKEIQKERDIVANKEADKKIEWEKFRDSFEKNKPSLPIASVFKIGEAQSAKSSEPSEKEIMELKSVLKNMIIKEVTNVRG